MQLGLAGQPGCRQVGEGRSQGAGTMVVEMACLLVCCVAMQCCQISLLTDIQLRVSPPLDLDHSAKSVARLETNEQSSERINGHLVGLGWVGLGTSNHPQMNNILPAMMRSPGQSCLLVCVQLQAQ